jgi:UDP-glucose 4-epimerase
MLEIAVESGVKKIIFPSSGGTIYGEAKKIPITESSPLNPQNPYAISKLVIEKYLDYYYTDYGLDYVIIRYSNPYGERQNPHGSQGVIPIFLNKIKNFERPVIYGDGKSLRDYIYIKDAIDATLLLMDNNNKEKIFNVGSGTGTSLNDLISILYDVTGYSISPRYIPNDRRYLQRTVLNIAKVRESVGWSPKVSLYEGIRRTWDYLNNSISREKSVESGKSLK